MKRSYAFLCLYLTLLSVAAPAQASCELEVRRAHVEFPGGGRYDVLSSAGLTGYLTFEVGRAGIRSDPLSSSALFESSSNQLEQEIDRVGAGEAEAELADCYGVMKIRVSAGSSSQNIQLNHALEDRRIAIRGDTLSIGLGAIERGALIRKKVDIHVPGGQFLESGSYEIGYKLLLHGGDVGSNDRDSSAGMLLVSDLTAFGMFRVDSALRIGIAGSGGRSQTVNLGTVGVSDKHVWPVSLQVLANEAYTLSFESENKGRLVSESHADVIPYSLDADGVHVPLRALSAELPRDKTNSRGEQIRLGFSIKGGGDYRAGRYHDTLKIRVFPRYL